MCAALGEIGGEATAEAVAWLSSMFAYHGKIIASRRSPRDG
jgi:hypothetical protein